MRSCKTKPPFLPVSAHDSTETREKKQAVNPLEFTDSAVCTATAASFDQIAGGAGGRVSLPKVSYILHS